MKKIKSGVTFIILAALLLSMNGLSGMLSAEGIISSAVSSDQDMKDSVIFPHDQVVEVNIELDESIYQDMINNAMEEEYVMADITYNGYSFEGVAVRPKGNSSLKQVVSSGDDRFSFKIDFNEYVDQDFFGITKINLNNLFEDPTLMAEYISYEMLDTLDAVASDTSYVALSINGDYYGLYLAVEEVNKPFLEENFGNKDGQLYKPEMGTGADLSYISDDQEDYTAIVPDDEDMTTGDEYIQFVKTIDQIIENSGETSEYKLSDVMNVDSFLKYLALSTTVVHMDAYQSGMFHNYYLYYNTDTDLYEWITWDLNMSFNGFPMSGLTDLEATQFLIDEPVIGSMDQYPLIEAVFTNEDYVESYHEYLDILASQYLDDETFENRVAEIYNMIKDYAKADTNAFYDMDTTYKSIFDNEDNDTMSLIEFASLRADNILSQLAGDLPSTNDGNGNEGSAGGMRPGGGMRPEGDNGFPEGDFPSGDFGNQDMNPDAGMTIDRLPQEILDMYEQGLLSEEITAYLDRGELPPRELMMELMEDFGQIDGQNRIPGDKGQFGGDGDNPMQPGGDFPGNMEDNASVGDMFTGKGGNESRDKNDMTPTDDAISIKDSDSSDLDLENGDYLLIGGLVLALAGIGVYLKFRKF